MNIYLYIFIYIHILCICMLCIYVNIYFFISYKSLYCSVQNIFPIHLKGLENILTLPTPTA